MTELPSKPTRKITDDPYGAAILIRRLVMEQGFVYWRRYVTAFALMAVSAVTTAGSTMLLGDVINQAYVDKNVRGIAILSGVTITNIRLTSSSTSRPTALINSVRTSVMDFAPYVSRARNSEECRAE